MINVLIYDDNKGVLEALQLFIAKTEDITCLGTFKNCSNIFNEIELYQPQVVLMDIDMPKVNGIEGLKIIRNNFPEVMVIMQTVFEEEERIFEAIQSGAHGYFLKKTPPARLIEGIRNVLDGGAPMTDTVARKVLDLFQKQDRVPLQKPNFNLTTKELEILGLLTKGLSYKMIALQCDVTYHTVNFHIKNIYEKLHVRSATAAIAKALGDKIV